MSKNSNCNSCKKSLRFFGPDLQNLNLQDSRSERIQQRWYNIFTTTNIQEHPPRVFQENWNTIITDCYLSFLHSETKIKAGYRLKTFPCKWHLKSSFSGNTYWKESFHLRLDLIVFHHLLATEQALALSINGQDESSNIAFENDDSMEMKFPYKKMFPNREFILWC